MDPDVAYATLIDHHAALSERIDAGRDLLTWLYGGGFMPTNATGTREELIIVCRFMRDSKHMVSPTPPTPSDQVLSLDTGETIVPPPTKGTSDAQLQHQPRC